MDVVNMAYSQLVKARSTSTTAKQHPTRPQVPVTGDRSKSSTAAQGENVSAFSQGKNATSEMVAEDDIKAADNDKDASLSEADSKTTNEIFDQAQGNDNIVEVVVSYNSILLVFALLKRLKTQV